MKCFTQEVPPEQAMRQSRLFSTLEESEFSRILYACRPTATSLALFFEDSDSSLQCHAQDGRMGSETIYYVCNEVVRRLKGQLKGFKLSNLEILDDTGKYQAVSGNLPSLSTLIVGKLLSRGIEVSGNPLSWIALIVAGLSSLIEVCLDFRRGVTIRWEVGR